MLILTDQERVGTLVAGKYHLTRVLGRGGMGVVYAALHTWTDREVAVKLLHPELAQDPSVVRRFLQEAKSAAGIKHPNVVDVLDMGQDQDGGVYLVLEYLQGEPLSQRIQRGPMSVGETFELLLPVLDALAAAHRKGIIHRDLKPDNIYLSATETGSIVPKVLDFGIAKVLHGQPSAQTVTGIVVGTPYYMSPEQASAKTSVGPSADVWSMGVVLYECLTGALPFMAGTVTGVLVAIMTTRAPSLAEQRDGLPVALVDAVARALDPDIATRFPDMGALRDALRAVHVSTPESVGMTSRAVPPRVPATSLSQTTPWSTVGLSTPDIRKSGSRRTLLVLGACALFALVSAGAWTTVASMRMAPPQGRRTVVPTPVVPRTLTQVPSGPAGSPALGMMPPAGTQVVTTAVDAGALTRTVVRPSHHHRETVHAQPSDVLRPTGPNAPAARSSDLHPPVAGTARGANGSIIID